MGAVLLISAICAVLVEKRRLAVLRRANISSRDSWSGWDEFSLAIPPLLSAVHLGWLTWLVTEAEAAPVSIFYEAALFVSFAAVAVGGGRGWKVGFFMLTLSFVVSAGAFHHGSGAVVPGPTLMAPLASALRLLGHSLQRPHARPPLHSDTSLPPSSAPMSPPRHCLPLPLSTPSPAMICLSCHPKLPYPPPSSLLGATQSPF